MANQQIRDKRHSDDESLGTSSSNGKRQRTTNASTYRHDEHTADCFVEMNEMRVNDQFCDVRLVVDSKKIPAHKMILAAASPYFRAMFSNPSFAEASQDEVTIQGVDSHALQSLVKFVYTSCIELTEDSVQSCLAAAHLLQFTRVIKSCCDYLESQLGPNNCLSIRDMFDMYGCIDSVNKVDFYIQRHFSEIVLCEEFLHLELGRLVDLIKCDEIVVKLEEQVYESVLAWIRFDLEDRQQYLAELMANVRFPMMNKNYVALHVETEPLLHDNPHCKDFIMEAFRYHMCKGLPSSSVHSPRTRPRFNSIEHLLIVGGSTNYTELYDLRDGRVQQGADMPTKRFRGGLAYLGGKVYSIGGRRVMNASNRKETVDVYDPTLNTWSPSRSMQEKRGAMGVAVHNKRIYVIGGYNRIAMATAEVFDPITDRWTYIASMPMARFAFAAAATKDGIYVVGGAVGHVNADNHVSTSSVERYNPEEDTWTSVANMDSVRVCAGVGVLDDILYVIGGKSILNQSLNTCEKYDAETDAWSPIANMNTARSNHGVVTHDGLIYAIGGFDDYYRLIDSIEVYCPNKDSWELLSWNITTRNSSQMCMIEKVVRQK